MELITWTDGMSMVNFGVENDTDETSKQVMKLLEGKTLGKAETILALALSEVHKEFSNKKIGDSND